MKGTYKVVEFEVYGNVYKCEGGIDVPLGQVFDIDINLYDNPPIRQINIPQFQVQNMIANEATEPNGTADYKHHIFKLLTK